MILKPVAQRLLEDPVIRDRCEGRLYFDRMPEGEPHPAILINKIAGRGLDELGPTQDDETTIQVDIWVEDGDQAYDLIVELGDHVRDLLEDRTWSALGYEVGGCSVERDNSTSQQPANSSASWTRRRSMDLRLTHTNNVARA